MSDTFEIEIVGTVYSTERFEALDLDEALRMAHKWSKDHLQDDGRLDGVISIVGARKVEVN